MKTIIEPFRIKMVEPIRLSTRLERESRIREANYNLFNLHSDDVIVDLLTDSGTGAMSDRQWSKMMIGDESYAGGRSFFRFESVVRDLTGYRFIIPTHQGRAAEKILFGVAVSKGQIVPNNSHFDTTRANVEYRGAEARDLLIPEARNFETSFPFKGNMDIGKLDALLKSSERERIPMVMLTITNNSWGGQPVSLANVRAASELCKTYRVPFILDACRFAENAYLIKLREEGQKHRSAREIAKEIFSLADGCTFSAKKDGIVNIGGVLALQNEAWATESRNLLILTEGFPTYGGLAGRDLEAIAQGLEEVLDETYLEYRLASTAYVGEHLKKEGVPIIYPPGGHAIFLDARAFLPHIPPEQFPGQALACELFVHGGIRSVEIGTLMFGHTDTKTGLQISGENDLVRLAIPRRTYTQSHMDYVIEAIIEVFQQRKNIQGLELEWEPPRLRHFTARLRPKRG